MHMEPGPRPTKQSASADFSDFQWLQCDACDQQRRVDNATFRLFHTDTWNSDAFARRRRELPAAFPILERRLCDWLMSLYSEQQADKENAVYHLCGEKIHGFLDQRDWLQRIGKEHARGFDELLAEHAARLRVTMAPVYAAHLSSWKAEDSGPRFYVRHALELHLCRTL